MSNTGDPVRSSRRFAVYHYAMAAAPGITGLGVLGYLAFGLVVAGTLSIPVVIVSGVLGGLGIVLLWCCFRIGFGFRTAKTDNVEEAAVASIVISLGVVFVVVIANLRA